MKGGNVHEYNDYVLRLANKINDTYRRKKTAANAHLWADFDGTRDKINDARTADHVGFLLLAAANPNGRLGMGVYVKDLGRNPATGEAWMAADWAETAKRAAAEGVTDPKGKIRNFLDWFYRGTDDRNREARKHHRVLRTYKRVYDRTISCRR